MHICTSMPRPLNTSTNCCTLGFTRALLVTYEYRDACARAADDGDARDPRDPPRARRQAHALLQPRGVRRYKPLHETVFKTVSCSGR